MTMGREDLTLFTIYDFAHDESDDDPAECAVHEVHATSPSDAVDVVMALREHGSDDEMFCSWVMAAEAPKIDATTEHPACDYGVRGTDIVVRRAKDDER